MLHLSHILLSDQSAGQHACPRWQGTRAPHQYFCQERAAAEHVVQLHRQAGGVALDVPAEEGCFPKALPKGGVPPMLPWYPPEISEEPVQVMRAKVCCRCERASPYGVQVHLHAAHLGSS